MQWVSKIFPFTFYTDIFVDQMLRGTPVGLLAARPLLHVAVHRFTAPVPAAPEKGLHGGKILGEIVI